MQVLDFTALDHNANYFKSRLGASRLCAVVKNNAYGHGIEHIVRYLKDTADCFAVGSATEAKQIGFVNKDILILLPQDKADTAAAIIRGYILTVDSWATLSLVCKTAANLQQKARVHIKIDSGMSRLGFVQNDIEKLSIVLQDCEHIIVEGVYSHFYGANTAECDKQLLRFASCAETVEKALNRPLIKHIANSGAVLLSSKYHLDMARVGLGLYGYGNENLLPVKRVTAQVISVKEVKSGSVVGYGGHCKVTKDTRVAVLNIGYAQGFARTLAGAKVVLNGTKCKVLAVCMAMTILDVDGVQANIGDAATLLGSGVDISNDSVSTYELLCNLK